MKHSQDFSMKEAMIMSQKLAHLSKAMWKRVEKDWQNWVKEYGLNINEHHILWITYHLKEASITDLSKFGVMHVSTAFNFSKKLEEQGYLSFSKNDADKRNTYIKLTEKGEELLIQTLDTYNPNDYGIFNGALAIREFYGKFPEFDDLMYVVRNEYGDEFIEFFDTISQTIEEDFDEENGRLRKKEKQNR
jgi:MarR family protease production transcriptional regulator HPr